MRICHITTVHQRYDIRIFWKQCVSAAKAGHEVVLLVNDELKDEYVHGVKIVSINRQSRGRIARVLSVGNRLRIFQEAKELNADVYQIHDPELLGLALNLKKCGFVVVYDSHEDVPRQILTKEWLPSFARPLVSRVFEYYENRVSRDLDGVIAPTPHIKERFGVINKNVWEVCNFPSLDEIQYSGHEYSNQNPTCYVGGLSVTRGIRQIAEATRKAGVELHLCGQFISKGLEDELRKYDHVTYFGSLGRPEVARFLVGASMGFVTLLNTPNDSMAYPIKLFEYMAAGLPVIASDFPVYKRIVEGYGCGICVNPLDVDAIAEAIIRIRNDSAFADELRKNGRKAITEAFNWESQARKLMDCYGALAKRSKG